MTKRIRRPLLVAAAVAVVFATLGDPIAPRAIAAAQLGERKGAATTAATPISIDYLLIADHSASMYIDTALGPASDPFPKPLRTEAARLVAALAGADVIGATDRVGAIHFGGGQPPDELVVIPLTVMANDAARMAFVKQVELNTVSMGYTRWDSALRAAIDLLERTDPAYGRPPYRPAGRDLRLIFQSDGVPQTTPDGVDEVQLRALRAPGGLYDQVRQRGWAITAVGLGIAAVPGPYADVMKDLADRTGGEYFAAPVRDELPLIIGRVVATARGVTPRNAVSVPTVQTFTLAPGLAAATFTVIKAADGITTTIVPPGGGVTAPDGDRITRVASDRFETVTVREPEAGVWTVVLDGKGTASVEVFVRQRIAAPTSSPEPQLVTNTAVRTIESPVRRAPAPSGPPAVAYGILGLVIALVGYLLWLRRVAARTGVRLVGEDEPTLPWPAVSSWLPNPLVPRVPLLALLEAYGADYTPGLRSEVRLTPRGPVLHARALESVVLNGEVLGSDGSDQRRALTEGDRIAVNAHVLEVRSVNTSGVDEEPSF